MARNTRASLEENKTKNYIGTAGRPTRNSATETSPIVISYCDQRPSQKKRSCTENRETEILPINKNTWQIFLHKEITNQLKMYDNSENCKNWSPAKCPAWCM